MSGPINKNRGNLVVRELAFKPWVQFLSHIYSPTISMVRRTRSSLAAQQYQGQPEIYETRSCYKRNLNSYSLNQGGKGVDSELGIAVRHENYRLEGLSPICYFLELYLELHILQEVTFSQSVKPHSVLLLFMVVPTPNPNSGH